MKTKGLVLLCLAQVASDCPVNKARVDKVCADDAEFVQRVGRRGVQQRIHGTVHLFGELRQTGLVKLEALRNAGVKNPLDAEAVFTVAADNDDTAVLIETHLRELEDLLGVGYARMVRGGELPAGTAVQVDVFDARDKYARCARSWKRRPDVGSDADYPDLSARDAAVMKELSGR